MTNVLTSKKLRQMTFNERQEFVLEGAIDLVKRINVIQQKS